MFWRYGWRHLLFGHPVHRINPYHICYYLRYFAKNCKLQTFRNNTDTIISLDSYATKHKEESHVVKFSCSFGQKFFLVCNRPVGVGKEQKVMSLDLQRK